MMRHGYPEGWANSSAWSLLLACILLLLLAITAIVVAVMWRDHDRPTAGPTPLHGGEALQLLERMYAAGEIDEDDFRKRRRTLAEDGRALGPHA